MTGTPTIIAIRRADERGATELGWLRSRHSFSFGNYVDPDHMGFRTLRVLNDDVVAPVGGFGEHPHRDMEIITWVLEGALRHVDSLGHGGVLRPGEAQVMSAGTGLRHSEMNASASEPVHFLQVWIVPSRRGLPARYAQQAFDAAGRRNAWQAVASGRGEPGALPINQDASMSFADLVAGPAVRGSSGRATLERPVAAGRYGYLHVAYGSLDAGGETLAAGDAIMLEGPGVLRLAGREQSQVLFFDLG